MLDILPTIGQLVLMVLLTTVLTVIILKRMMNQYLPAGVRRMASQWASEMGRRSGDKATIRKNGRLQVEAKKMIADGIYKEIPFGDKVKAWGLTPNHVFSLVGDKDFMNFLKLAYGTYSSVKNVVGGVELPDQLTASRTNRRTARQHKVPLMR